MCWDCWGNKGGDPYKIFTQGGVDVEDFEEEFRHTPSRKYKKKNKRKKAKPGCVGNDGKAHVYVWTTERNVEDLFFRFYGFHKYEKKVCIGCGRRDGTQLTERYIKIKDRRYNKLTKGGEFNVKRGEPVPRGWRYRPNRFPSYGLYSWETYDEDYKSYRAAYIKEHGYNERVHGNRYAWWY